MFIGEMIVTIMISPMNVELRRNNRFVDYISCASISDSDANRNENAFFSVIWIIREAFEC